MNAYKLLRQIPLFVDLDDDAVQALAIRAQLRSYQSGERIVSQSDKIQAFFVVLSGQVKIFRSNEDGKEQILYLVQKGQPFCFCTAFTNKPYPVNVTALEESWVANIPASDMEDLARKEPMLLLKIMQTLAGRLLETMNMVESLALQGTSDRIAYYLLQAEIRTGKGHGVPFDLPLSHKEMAKLMSTHARNPVPSDSAV